MPMLQESEYLSLLGLSGKPGIDEIKRAYRQKARELHPDINQEPGARDKFILATEAYEFLLASAKRAEQREEEYRQFIEDWKKYRQARTRHKARVYSSTSYKRFTGTKFYRTTQVYDGARIVFALVIALMVLIYSVIGFIYGRKHPLPGEEPPSFIILCLFILLGIVFFTISLVFLKVFLENSSKKREHERNKKSFQ